VKVPKLLGGGAVMVKGVRVGGSSSI